MCVLNYDLNITEDGGTRATMPVDTSGVALVGDLNLCNNSYSFTASATTKNSTSDFSDPVTGEVNFSGGNVVIFLLLGTVCVCACEDVSVCV